MAVTIKDVAKYAGVGVGTVSRVLNGEKSVGEETRQSILSAIEALNYTPNQMAVKLRKNANKIINEALLKSQKIESESAILKKNISIFKSRLKNIIEQQLQMVDDIDDIRL